ncbi:MAG: HupE/UreJ family protein [Gammaproteobacteria bacterium]|nr:HupE/UreJ family protein [Gammaproteobacteria bacterium]
MKFSRRYFLFSLFSVCWLLLAVVSSVQADVVKPALVEISLNTEGTYSVELRASIEALLTGINGRYKNTRQSPNAKAYDELRKLSAAELRLAFTPFEAELTHALKLRFDGVVANLQITQVSIPPTGYTKVPRISVIEMSGKISRQHKQLTWYYPELFGDNAVRVRQVNEVDEKWHWSTWQWLRNDAVSEPFSLTELFAVPPWYETASMYLVAGFEHILPKGLDHILFVLGLFLFSLTLRPLLWQVTMFTVAHTLTLGLAMNGWISLPAQVVEPLIAVSIAYIGFENVFRATLQRSRLLLVFVFGLLHGLGFASVLQEFGLPKEAFALALISFNIGVELGQLAIVSLAFLAVALWWRDKIWYRARIVIPASLLIAVTGLVWAWQRL